MGDMGNSWIKDKPYWFRQIKSIVWNFDNKLMFAFLHIHFCQIKPPNVRKLVKMSLFFWDWNHPLPPLGDYPKIYSILWVEVSWIMFHNHLRFLVPNPLPYVCLIICRNIFSADSPGPALSCANLCGENLCCRHIITQSWGPPLWVPCHHKLGSQGMGALLFLQHAPRHSGLLWTFLFVCFRSSGLQVF